MLKSKHADNYLVSATFRCALRRNPDLTFLEKMEFESTLPSLYKSGHAHPRLALCAVKSGPMQESFGQIHSDKEHLADVAAL